MSDCASTDDAEKPYPLRQLMTRRVLLSAIDYVTLSLVDIAFRTIQPLFFSTPVENGGLGLAPPSIGNILASFGALHWISAHLLPACPLSVGYKEGICRWAVLCDSHVCPLSHYEHLGPCLWCWPDRVL